MASTADPATPGDVAILGRPPVQRSTLVRSDVQHTFTTFVRTIGAWWPVQPLSHGKQRVRDVTIEERGGGRVYETWDDGTTVDWGEITLWDPPHRFVMTWTNTPAPTEVEITFRVLAPALTRVALEHRGWEALTEEQLRQDCARPDGGYRGGAYAGGWALVLARLTAAAEGAPES